VEFKILDKYLGDAIGKEKNDLSIDNPYKIIGFDGEKKRLGWAKRVMFGTIVNALKKLDPILEGKTNFIFVGIGGSINGIKSLFPLFGKHSLYTLDSLDPKALEELLGKVKDRERTLVIPISKSGTTRETQLIALTLKELFGRDWHSHYLWLSDPQAFEKLDSLGWKEAAKYPIQLDGESDIGGRFSCPHTLIFYLPLYLLLNKNIKKMQAIYENYFKNQKAIREKGYEFAKKCDEQDRAFVHPLVNKKIAEDFTTWVVQLFQESLGSKSNLAVKTLEPFEKKEPLFLPLELGMRFSSPVSELMAQMYFFQSFLVFYSVFRRINFVTQDFVEKYKEEMKKLENEEGTALETLSLSDTINRVKQKIKKDTLFIEIVLYFYPDARVIKSIRDSFQEAFKDKKIFVFIGSDWNHHSYQAAFGDKNTFFLLLLSPAYRENISGIMPERLHENIKILKLISRATYLTIKDKAILAALSI